jgi:hypothetical protein
MTRGVAIAAAAGYAAAFITRNRLDISAAVGIVAMSIGAWIICGAGPAFAVFGGFTWITVLLSVDLKTRAAPKKGDS